MPEESDSLKAEMSELLRADRERAKERRPTALVGDAPAPEPVAEPEPDVEPPRRRRRFFF
jgi:hypothetical protein